MMMYGGRDAATDEAARRPSVVRQADVGHGLPSVIVLRITLMSLPPSPVCVCCGLPQPRSRRAVHAATDAPAMSDRVAENDAGDKAGWVD